VDAGETATLTVANVTGLVPGLARAGTTLVVDPSHAAFQGLAADEDGSVLIDVLANDSVGDTLTIVSVGAARHGTAAIEDGQVRYTPAADYAGATSTSTVPVTVTGANDAPVGAPTYWPGRFIACAPSIGTRARHHPVCALIKPYFSAATASPGRPC
jgi:hypothetical protein